MNLSQINGSYPSGEKMYDCGNLILLEIHYAGLLVTATILKRFGYDCRENQTTTSNTP